MSGLAKEIKAIKSRTMLPFFLVSSGAIGLGRSARLQKGEMIDPVVSHTPKEKQKDAVEGQYLLYKLWQHHFYPQQVEQSLVTHHDIVDPLKRKELIGCYNSYVRQQKVPVINEDDARSLEEIDTEFHGQRVFRDNDGLASLHAQMLKAEGYHPLLVILTNTKGIYVKEEYLQGGISHEKYAVYRYYGFSHSFGWI